MHTMIVRSNTLRILSFFVLPFFMLAGCQTGKQQHAFFNADRTIRLDLETDGQGRPFYRLYYLDALVLDTSYMGVILEHADLSCNLVPADVTGPVAITDEYEMMHGKQRHIKYAADQYRVKYNSGNEMTLEVLFNLSENGMAYSYIIGKAGDSTVIVKKELSSFGFPASTKAWMQPMSVAKTGWCETNPSYEEHYLMEIPVDKRSPLGVGYVFPALFKVDDNWVLLSETDLHRDYCGSKLQYDDALGSLRVTFPQKEEIFPGGALLPNGTTPFITPWRTIAIGDLGDVVESTLGTDLAAPAIPMDTGFIGSGLSSWSWVLLKDDFTNYETSHRFIDYASEMHWPYCLIDADWDRKIGFEKIQELVDYAATKNVKIWLWYNSSGDWNSTTYSPKGRLIDPGERRAEFARLQQMGIAGCKVDFFGGDGQSMIAYYHDILNDAAGHGLMLNFHGATLPRGWQRTYPNLMTVEAIKGEEFITFEQVNADRQPSHCAVIPFTRNVYAPMDFTPMVLDSIPRITRRTTTAFELALPVLFASGVQHMAEIPEGMRKMPDYVVEFLQDIPTRWDETRFVSGYPGKEVIIARRKGDTWFVAGINGEDKEKTVNPDLSFIGKREGELFHDGEGKVPEHGQFATGSTEILMKPYGGFVMKIY